MKITLYKGCILNNEYSEVFYDANTLLNYLDTLQNKEIEIADIYPQLSGSFVITNINLLDAYDYNYIKIEGKNGTSFAFINNIEVINISARINYLLDVWSTFYGKWKLRDSLLGRTRYPELYECDFANLPLNYISNGDIEYTPLLKTNSMQVVFDAQFYKKDKSGKDTVRYPVMCIVKRYMDTSGGVEGSDKLSPILQLLNIVYGYENNLYIKDGTFADFQVEIVHTYLIPSDIDLSNIYYRKEGSLCYNQSPYIEIGAIYVCAQDESHSADSIFEASKKISIPIDEKIIGVGTKTNVIEVPFNYNIQNITLKCFANSMIFAMYSVINGKQSEITQLFEFDAPMESISSTEQQLRALNRFQRNVKAGTDVLSGVASIVTDVASMGAGSIATGAKLATMKGRGITKSKQLMRQQSYQSSLENASGGIIGGISQIANGVTDLIVNNAPIYTSNYSTNEIPYGIINSYYGFGYFRLIETINDKQVSDSIEQTGYEVSKIIKEIKNINSGEGFDIIKFDFIRLTGCTIEINNILSNILLSGTKIWYTIEV